MNTENKENLKEETLASETENRDVYTDEPEYAAPVKKKERKKDLRFFWLILVLAAAGAAGYYFWERQQPIETVKTFLTDVQKMNFVWNESAASKQ